MKKNFKCRICGNNTEPVSKTLSVCLDCIRQRTEQSLPYIMKAHRNSRKRHNLPIEPPRAKGGIQCSMCSNLCIMGERDRGFCGLRWNERGLKALTDSKKGLFYAYIDPHVTNCCSAWFCPAGTGIGYPKYAYKNGPELGYSNLAVFFYGCNFDCLFCQNPSHKEFSSINPKPVETISNIVRSNPRISCICYFGGSPEPQMLFALHASNEALTERTKKTLRICFEWNGCGDPVIVRRAAELVQITGGNIKFDFKAWDPYLSLALSGVPNKRAYQNFEMIAKELQPSRRAHPMLTATTLMVPGYVDAVEVEKIAMFIAGLDSEIPYSLLSFHPAYMMADLPYTGRRQASECYNAAKKHLDRVNVGNLHILGLRSMKEFKRIANKKNK